MEKQATVIIGDNTTEFGQVCTDILQELGFSVTTTAKDGSEVLNAINTLLPDVVVMDAYMKNLDAIAVMDAVNESELAKKPAFIVTSAYDNVFIQNTIMQKGAAYYVLKPFDLNVLAKRISELTNYIRSDRDTVLLAGEEKSDLETEINQIIHKNGEPDNK